MDNTEVQKQTQQVIKFTEGLSTLNGAAHGQPTSDAR
jgi:hypothetical protein